jgi:linoleoyl-CoA desaturase
LSTATQSRYLPHGPFHTELHRRVDQHFARLGTAPNEAPGMRVKTAVIVGWLLASYAGLLFWATTPWQGAILAVSLGLAIAGIGFNVQHDGNHGGYSSRPRLSGAMGFALDLVGGSSYVWRWKHNVFHHSNPNLVGLDADIDLQPFCRLAPKQPRHAAHRAQALYIWFLYAFLAVKWQFVDDFRDISTGTIGGQRFPRPRGWSLAALLAGKLFFVSWTLVLPMLLHPVWAVLACYAVTSVTLSLALAITFQLAHVTDGATFSHASRAASTEWAVHQVESSVNFCPSNRFLTWYLGGLNYQIEHHLFPKVCHLHLPDLAAIVEQTCKEYGVSYRVHQSATAALASHVRWIHRLGAPVEAN